MTHLKKYWIWYLIAFVVIIAAIMAYLNWETVKGWFSSTSGTTRVSGGNGSTRQMCVDLGGGDCAYLGLSVPCIECTKRGIIVK